MAITIQILDFIGVFTFALSGAIVAKRDNRDVYVIFLMAGMTGMGGGVLRDVILNRTPPIFLGDRFYLLVIVLASLCVIFASELLEHRWSVLPIVYLDALGLGVFVVLGINEGFKENLNWHASLFLGVITAVAGGTMRDLMLHRVPIILSREVYATATIVGGLFYLFLKTYVSPGAPLLNFLFGCFMVVLIRLVSFHRRWTLPGVSRRKKSL